jgi:hypothetical protein
VGIFSGVSVLGLVLLLGLLVGSELSLGLIDVVGGVELGLALGVVLLLGM